MFQQLLVLLDGSSCAEQALPVAAQIARASGGSIFLLQVAFAPMYYPEAWSLEPLRAGSLLERETVQAGQYLKTIVGSSVLANIPTTSEVICGIPAQDMLIIAESRGVDLIVLSCHGCTEFTRWMQGSVPYTLVHWSRVPVLILREQQPSSLPSAQGPMKPFRLLVPLDGSPFAESVLMPAAFLTAALAFPAQGEMQLAHIVKSVAETTEKATLSIVNEEAFQHAWNYLAHVKENLQEIAQNLKMAITCSVTFEPDITRSLLTMAEQGAEGEKACDLIALSTHGRSGLPYWTTGNMTERLLNSTKLPILVI